MRIFAVLACLLALVATCEAAWCHTSAYKLPCTQVEAAKKQLWAACASEAPGGVSKQGGFTTTGACCTVVQKTTDEHAWKKYAKCEKANAAYVPLKASGKACDTIKTAAAC